MPLISTWEPQSTACKRLAGRVDACFGTFGELHLEGEQTCFPQVGVTTSRAFRSQTADRQECPANAQEREDSLLHFGAFGIDPLNR